MPHQNATSFDSYSELPQDLVPTSMQVMQYAGGYLKIDKNTTWFDWKAFKDSVSHQKGDKISFDKFKDVTIASKERTVQVMVDAIVAFLAEALNVALSPADIKSLKKTIEVTFTSLKEKSSHGFLAFSTSSDKTNSAWEYRIQFAFPNPKLKDYFYSLVTTIKLSANISTESGWFGLTASSSKAFEAQINALELVVNKDFKNHP